MLFFFGVRMLTKRFAFLWLLLTLSLSLFAFRRHCGIHAAPKLSVPPSSSVRRWNSSVARKASRTVSAVSNRTEYVTKVQVEDLDEEATSTGCLRLRELDFCEDGTGTARYPNAVGHSSEVEAKSALKMFSPFLDDPSCRKSLRVFFCVALTPSCSSVGDESPAALPPCRTLCSAAVEGCGEVVDGGEVEWPVEWSCDRFPVDGLCIDQSLHHGTGDHKLKSGSNEPQTFSIESRGSLQPPPSSAFDSELLAEEPDETVSSSHPTARRSEDDGSRFFRGWADVQGLGRSNDYCRVLGTNSRDRVLSCALNGTEDEQQKYISKYGFDAGRPKTAFMKDVDGDRRDDYCRCVGNSRRSQLICMKAGERGFYGGKKQPGSQYTIRVPTASVYSDYCQRSRG